MSVTEVEIARLAGKKAATLNLPWDPATAVVRRPLLGALSGMWRVVSTIEAQNAIVIMGVRERSREAWPVRVIYAAALRAPLSSRLGFAAAQLALGALVGSAAFLLARQLAGMSFVSALAISLAWGALSAVVTIRYRKIKAR